MQLDPGKRIPGQRIGMLLAGLLVVVVGVVIFVVAQKDTKDNKANDAINAAQKATDKGNYDNALETLKKAESSAKTTEEKVRLYNDLAAAAANAGKVQDALDYYAKKHALDPSSKKADGYLVGELYERADDPQKAIEYYKLYVEYAKTISQDEYGNAEVQSLEARIQELEGGQQ